MTVTDNHVCLDNLLPVRTRRNAGEQRYLAMLDDAVRWAAELEMYVIIDWHTIGNMLTGVYHLPMYRTSRT